MIENVTEYVWVKKLVTTTQYYNHFAKIPSYHLVDKQGNNVWVGYKQPNPLRSHEYELTNVEIERITNNGDGLQATVNRLSDGSNKDTSGRSGEDSKRTQRDIIENIPF